MADSCPDVKNEGKDGFQQAFTDDFHLSLKVEGKTTDRVVSYLYYWTTQSRGTRRQQTAMGKKNHW